MKVATPMISWHARDPVLSVDTHPLNNKIATAGADKFVRIWKLKDNSSEDEKGELNVKILANLKYHSAGVNIVRFSPDGKYLASAGDDGMIFVYQVSHEVEESVSFGEEKQENAENWVRVKTLRFERFAQHSTKKVQLLQDALYLIGLFTGSVDNKCILWDVEKGKPVQYFSDHSSYVQGVAWDPLSHMLVSQSADRSCRVYSARKTKRNKNSKQYRLATTIKRRLFEDVSSKTENQAQNANYATASESAEHAASSAKKTPTGHNLFCDETVQTFFRRLAFSPDGTLLAAPTGNLLLLEENLKKNTATTGSKAGNIHTLHIFHRDSLKKPAFYFPFEYATCVVQFSPMIYKKRRSQKRQGCEDKDNEHNDNDNDTGDEWTNFPYRMVFAVASLKRVAFFDTESRHPFSVIENLHYATITDLSWSSDGRTLVVSSQDGYCSVVKFEEGQLGEILDEKDYEKHFAKVIKARRGYDASSDHAINGGGKGSEEVSTPKAAAGASTANITVLHSKSKFPHTPPTNDVVQGSTAKKQKVSHHRQRHLTPLPISNQSADINGNHSASSGDDGSSSGMGRSKMNVDDDVKVLQPMQIQPRRKIRPIVVVDPSSSSSTTAAASTTETETVSDEQELPSSALPESSLEGGSAKDSKISCDTVPEAETPLTSDGKNESADAGTIVDESQKAGDESSCSNRERNSSSEDAERPSAKKKIKPILLLNDNDNVA
eukprot:jgi/Bigna1/145766/aug1.103_g20474